MFIIKISLAFVFRPIKRDWHRSSAIVLSGTTSVLTNKVLGNLSVNAEAKIISNARSDAKGGNASNNIGTLVELRATAITKAGASSTTWVVGVFGRLVTKPGVKAVQLN